MKKYGIVVFLGLLLQNCSSNSDQIIAVENSKDTTAVNFFPVTSFIKGQMMVLDSLPVTPLQLTTIKGKTDSAWVSKNKLRSLLAPFTAPVINETNFTGLFKETRFTDQTINAVTFTYDPITTLPDSILLRHWDVYVNPETGNVEKVYLVKKIMEQQQDITQQLTWQTGKSAKITTILNKPGGNMELVKEVLVIWDFN